MKSTQDLARWIQKLEEIIYPAKEGEIVLHLYADKTFVITASETEVTLNSIDTPDTDINDLPYIEPHDVAKFFPKQVSQPEILEVKDILDLDERLHNS